MPAAQSRLITCERLHGGTIRVPASQLTFRPAAYAIVTHRRRILLVNTKSTSRWFFPGGAIEPGELAADTARRETLEETNISIAGLKLFTVKDTFFYYDPLQRGYHCLSFIFTARPASSSLPSAAHNPDRTDEANTCAWVELAALSPVQMQGMSAAILQDFLTQSPRVRQKS